MLQCKNGNQKPAARQLAISGCACGYGRILQFRPRFDVARARHISCNEPGISIRRRTYQPHGHRLGFDTGKWTRSIHSSYLWRRGFTHSAGCVCDRRSSFRRRLRRAASLSAGTSERIVSAVLQRQAHASPSPAKKSLGQNFLVDRRIVSRILAAADLTPNDTVLEIGPGRGILTRPLAERAASLTAVELDDHLAATLTTEFAERSHIRIIHADAREIDIPPLVPQAHPTSSSPTCPTTPPSP